MSAGPPVTVAIAPRVVRRQVPASDAQIHSIAEALLQVGLTLDWGAAAVEVCRHRVGPFEVTYEIIPERLTLKVVAVSPFFAN